MTARTRGWSWSRLRSTARRRRPVSPSRSRVPSICSTGTRSPTRPSTAGRRCSAPSSRRPRRFPLSSTRSPRSNFLGVLAGALNADNVLKGRSLFADQVGNQVGSAAFTLVDDGRRADGPGAGRSTARACRAGGRSSSRRGSLRGFLHSTYTARRAGGGQRSTGNGSRGGYKSRRASARRTSSSRPGAVRGDCSPMAEGGVLIHGRFRRALGREPDQRGVQRGCDGPADRAGRHARGARCAR